MREGAGKVHRHIKIHQVGDLNQPELRQLMATALTRLR
jgi:hypothetical protein